MSDTSSRINQSRLTRTDSKFGSKLLLPEAHALETPKSHIRHENSIINSTNRRAGAQKTDEKTHDAKVRKLNKLWAEAGGKLKSRYMTIRLKQDNSYHERLLRKIGIFTSSRIDHEFLKFQNNHNPHLNSSLNPLNQLQNSFQLFSR